MKWSSKMVVVTIGVIFLMSLGVSSVRADSLSFNAHSLLEDMNRGQQIKLDLLNLSQEEAVGYLQHQHSNEGKHLGFSVASIRQGPRLGVIGYYDRTTATQNPEPATMILFGTGLLAIGAYTRRKFHH